MPLIQSLRYTMLRYWFDAQTFSTSLGSRLGYCNSTGPLDDGTMANETTQVPRNFRDDTASHTPLDNDGWKYSTYNHQVSAVGTDLLTYFFISPSSTPGTAHTFYEQFPIPVNVASGEILRFGPYVLKYRFSDVFMNYRASVILDTLVDDGATISGFSSSWMALSSTQPTRTGGNLTEPTGGGYTRVVTSHTTSYSVTSAVTSYAENVVNITFPTATAPWSGLTHWALMTASTGGNMYMSGALDSTVNVLTGETPSFLIGDFRVSMGP